MRLLLLATPLLLTAMPAVAQSAQASARPIAAATEAARIAPRFVGWQGVPSASIPATRRVAGTLENSAQLFVYAPGALYQVYAAVGQVTDIILQEGETLSDTGAVAAGDTVRWVIGEASSGAGASRRTHILVKPTDPGLRTNLVINTTKRTYHVELRSTPATYMASVGWSYPQDELIAVRVSAQATAQVAATQVQTGIDPAKLDFAYRLTGANPPWKPVQVFDDGAKTYLLFPDSIGQSELPPLFLIGDTNKAELVNYRVSGRYMVVDRLFSIAELRLGTKKQQIVRIERTRGRERHL